MNLQLSITYIVHTILLLKDNKSFAHFYIIPEEWSSSDEETLDMMRPLVFVKLCEMSDSSDDELLSDIACKRKKVHTL
jgi:hypothetical protein